VCSFILFIECRLFGFIHSTTVQCAPYAGVRGNDIGRNIFNVERFGVIQWVISGAEKIVCVNEHLQRRLLLAFPEVKFKSLVIPNGINSINKIDFKDKSKANILKTTTWGHEDLLLVFVGTLREKKGVVPLLNALELCNNERVKLLVVGPDLGSVELKMCGPLWEKLQQKGVLYVTGLVPRENVADWVIGCDVVVVPSLDDGMANGLLEGMLLGLCPIGTDVFNDVISNNENGVPVPSNDSKALAESFNYLDKNREKLLQMGINAKLTIERNHVARDEAKKYLNLFTTVLHNAEREKNSTL
jgi:glycosyltransferase involved in cell wall biosynthesis